MANNVPGRVPKVPEGFPDVAFPLLADAIGTIGTSGFMSAVAALCRAVSPYNDVFVSAYFKTAPPAEIYSDLSPRDARKTIPPYIEFAYLLDPFFALFSENAADGVYRLRDCAPDNFTATDYYKRFYGRIGVSDECGILINFGPDACLLISLGQRDPNRPVVDEPFLHLSSILPVLQALCHRHWPRLEPDCVEGRGRLSSHLQQAFDRFGSKVLSRREAEIVRLILKGHSSKSMARIFTVSPETVKVHRKRIYAKLDIASQGELFATFIEALSMTPPDSTEDPLALCLAAR